MVATAGKCAFKGYAHDVKGSVRIVRRILTAVTSVQYPCSGRPVFPSPVITSRGDVKRSLYRHLLCSTFSRVGHYIATPPGHYIAKKRTFHRQYGNLNNLDFFCLESVINVFEYSQPLNIEVLGYSKYSSFSFGLYAEQRFLNRLFFWSRCSFLPKNSLVPALLGFSSFYT